MSLNIVKPLNVYFLTFHPFPHGLAQTNRLISLARGLIESGCNVKVVCLKPTEISKLSLNINPQGNIYGIEYIYPSGTTLRATNFAKRLKDLIFGISRTSLMLIKDNRKHKIDFIFAGILGFVLYVWFYLICRFLRIKYLQERSEYPFIKNRKTVFDSITLNLYRSLVCKLFDGFVVITERLKEYFKPYLRKDCPVFKLPILVESERFLITPDLDEKYIAYCGSMQGNKDGIPDLLAAFSLISNEHPEIKLLLIGSTDFKEFQTLKARISEFSLDHRIVFTGIIDRYELPTILVNAMMLVLARPKSLQAEGGFPTKLGEYLATGKPVLVTDVGEISDYLRDGVNAYIAPPGNPEQFALKMKFILEHYDQALKVGLEGRNLAQTVFDYKNQGKLLCAWLNDI